MGACSATRFRWRAAQSFRTHNMDATQASVDTCNGGVSSCVGFNQACSNICYDLGCASYVGNCYLVTTPLPTIPRPTTPVPRTTYVPSTIPPKTYLGLSLIELIGAAGGGGLLLVIGCVFVFKCCCKGTPAVSNVTAIIDAGDDPLITVDNFSNYPSSYEHDNATAVSTQGQFYHNQQQSDQPEYFTPQQQEDNTQAMYSGQAQTSALPAAPISPVAPQPGPMAIPPATNIGAPLPPIDSAEFQQFMQFLQFQQGKTAPASAEPSQ